MHTCNCIMSNCITCAMANAVSAVLDSQEAYLPVCYDQWWTSSVTAGHIYYSSWKEAITSTISFVHRKLTREQGRRRWPKLLNEMFSAKATQQKPLNFIGTDWHTQRTITVTPQRMCQGLMSARNTMFKFAITKALPFNHNTQGGGAKMP